jgi:hypothetical protein
VLSSWRVGVVAASIMVHGCCMWGDRGAVIAVCGCCGCHHHGTWVLRLPLLWHMGVAAAIVAACGCCGCHCCGIWVLWLPLLQCMGVAASGIMVCGCCGCHHRASQGVVGAVVTPCGSCPHHTSSLSLLSIEGPGGPSRERQPYTSARRQYLDAKVDVSQEKKRKRREKSYQ